MNNLNIQNLFSTNAYGGGCGGCGDMLDITNITSNNIIKNYFNMLKAILQKLDRTTH